MTDSDRRIRHRARLDAQRTQLATKFRAELPQLRAELAEAEAAGRENAAQGLRNRIVYRERVLARHPEDV